MFWNIAIAQYTLEGYILDNDTKNPLVGATIVNITTNKGVVTDTVGYFELEKLPQGLLSFQISFVGYESKIITYALPLSDSKPVTIFLESGAQMEGVVVNATRTSRTIDEIPTRIEVLSAEELGEKAVMNSTNIAMLLRESTGILMQQTSASSANQSIRIQGLDGRYTQLLKDGFPLYSGFAGGLSIMQIPPIDLKQVEVIKGSSSTLYGGGAIAGLINLVTKQPNADHPDLSVMLNQTTAGGTTFNSFYAEKYEKTGASMYVSANRQQPYDPNDDGFSDIPKIRSLTLNPRFYIYPSDKAKLWVGVNASFEEREGGDLEVIENGPSENNQFSELNNSQRIASQLRYDQQINDRSTITVKNSIGSFIRNITIPSYQFDGEQLNSFTEINYQNNGNTFQWILGGNLITDNFSENGVDSDLERDYQNVTTGAFSQGNWDISEGFALEGGLRTDYNSTYGTFVLPRLSMFYEFNTKLSARLGGGLGYVLPTIFTEQAESLTFRNILPIAPQDVVAETSQGVNFDINYETLIGSEVSFSLNQLFYYTRLQDALILTDDLSSGLLSFENAASTVVSQGFETNAKFGWHDFKLFLQYAFIDARLNYLEGSPQKPLTPQHNAGAVLMFEQHGRWRIGLEAYYTGQQFRTDRSLTDDFWIVGLMGLREWGHWSFFLNFENFIDTRQSRFENIVSPPLIDPSFSEIWAPVDGFVANTGFIYRFFKADEDHHH